MSRAPNTMDTSNADDAYTPPPGFDASAGGAGSASASAPPVMMSLTPLQMLDAQRAQLRHQVAQITSRAHHTQPFHRAYEPPGEYFNVAAPSPAAAAAAAQAAAAATPTSPVDAAASSSHYTPAEHFISDHPYGALEEAIGVPKSPPYFVDFIPNLDFLCGPNASVVDQYHRFYELWTAFQQDRGLLIAGHDTKKLGARDIINAFEMFRATVTRGGFHRLFALLPVLTETPPLDEHGRPLYAMSLAEMPYEIGSPEEPEQIPPELAHAIYVLRDGHFFKNQQHHRSLRYYYERYLLAFETEYCWASPDSVRPYLTLAPETTGARKNAQPEYGMQRYTIGDAKLEYIEAPPKYRPDADELRKMKRQFDTMSYPRPLHPIHLNISPTVLLAQAMKTASKSIAPSPTFGSAAAAAAAASKAAAASAAPATPASTVAAPAAVVPSPPSHAHITWLHRIGTYALARTFQAVFLSNPMRLASSLVREFVCGINHLLAASKLYALKMSYANVERDAVDRKLRSILTHRLNSLSPDAPEHRADADFTLPDLLQSAPPSWYLDTLLVFEYDIVTRLLDLLLHPRSLRQRVDTLLDLDEGFDVLTANSNVHDIDAAYMTDPTGPLLSGLPSTFASASHYNNLPPAAHAFFVRQLVYHLDHVSLPNVAVPVLTILQNWTYPGSVLQKLVETQVKGRKSTIAEDEDPPILVPSVRRNILRHPTLVSTLLDFIDSDLASRVLIMPLENESLQTDASMKDEFDRFDILDVPPRDVKDQLKGYITRHSTSEFDAPVDSNPPIVSEAHSAVIKSEPATAAVSLPSPPDMNGVVKMEIDADDRSAREVEADGDVKMSDVYEESKEALPTAPAHSASPAASPSSPPSFISLANSIPREECRYLALQILSNLIVELPWTATPPSEVFVSTLVVPTAADAAQRSTLYWREMAREFDAYYEHVAALAASSSSDVPPDHAPAPSRHRLEFLLSTFQLLLHLLLHSASTRSLLEQMLPCSHSAATAAPPSVASPAPSDFYATLISIATLDLGLRKKEPSEDEDDTDAANTSAPEPTSPTNGIVIGASGSLLVPVTVSKKAPAPLHWSERLQLAALELLIQMVMHSATCTGLLLRTKTVFARLVRLMACTTSERLKRTAAVAVTAILAHLHRQDQADAKQRFESQQTQAPGSVKHEEGAPAVASAPSPSRLVAVFHPHRAAIQEAVSADPDCAVLLAKWIVLATKLEAEQLTASKEANTNANGTA